MGWLNKQKEDDLPKELQGKTQEEVVAALSEAEKMKTTLANLDAAKKGVDADLVKLRGEHTTLAQRLSALEAEKKKAAPAPTTVEVPSVLDDEETAINMRVDARTADVRQHALNANILSARMYAENHINKDPLKRQLLEKYKNEVDQAYMNVHPTARADVNTYIRCLDGIVGSHIHELADIAKKNHGELFVENAGGGHIDYDKKKSEIVLTDEEKRLAKRFGIAEKDYLASKTEKIGAEA